jgi:predicted phosphodiesterase
MPVAALADIHGNVQALDAVLADPRLATAEPIVVLGDVVAGAFPRETLERLSALGERVRVLRGNADRHVLEGTDEDSAWVRDRLGPERLSELRAWPLSFAIEVGALGSIRCCHATPSDDEAILTRLTPDSEFAAALAGTAESVVVGGHTHVQIDRRTGSWRFVSVGSVGLPYERQLGAYWALLGPDVALLRTEYDVEAAAAAARRSGQPRGEEIAELLLRPPAPEEAAVEFEAIRRAQAQL